MDKDEGKDVLERLLIEQILFLQKETMKMVLLYAQAAMTETQFHAFRKLVLDEFGSKGLRQKIYNAVTRIVERAGAEARE